MKNLLIGLLLCPALLAIPGEDKLAANTSLTANDIGELLGVTTLSLEMPCDIASLADDSENEERYLEISLVEIQRNSSEEVQKALTAFSKEPWTGEAFNSVVYRGSDVTKRMTEPVFRVPLSKDHGGLKKGEPINIHTWILPVNFQAGWKWEMCILVKSRLGSNRNIMYLTKGEWEAPTTQASTQQWIESEGDYYYSGILSLKKRSTRKVHWAKKDERAIAVRVAIK